MTPPTTHTHLDRWLFALVAVAVVVLGCVGCGAFPAQSYACGSANLPPVAVDPAVCHNGTYGYRWYSAPQYVADDITTAPQWGRVLDYSWWHGETGTIGYGRGYDPRPNYTPQPGYAPSAPAATQLPAEPSGAKAYPKPAPGPVKPTPNLTGSPTTAAKATSAPKATTAPKAPATTARR